ncbi:Uma2 family endonuclease [Methylosinus sporium]|uniref:Uma2 family endonuclease n=1 Tax=Methylosinus sporium TaxID=428 RepID=A0A2U1SMG0_METSR|nr:Uma2 family endonuclease [Methylosinus sporium]PWB92801.1 Uma2 family endonuclease [Methylosinus sporium]
MSRPSSQYEYMSLDDFEELLADKPANEKWELIGGRVVRMMVGARWEHHFIARNLAFGLMQRLRAKGSSCQVFQETFFLKEKAIDSAMLPDVMVHRGAMEPGATSLNDPTVLVEVMSEGSKARDRFEKWAVYQKLPSLRHYVLVERDRAHIETFDRAGADWVGVQILDGLEAELNLPAIGVSVPLAEIYRDVITD